MPKTPNSQLTLFLGPAGCGKTQQCLDGLVDAIQHVPDPLQRDLLFILPTLEHRERVVDLLLRRSVDGFFGRLITTFDETFSSFLKLSGFRFASDATRFLIMREIALAGEFQYFKEAARTNGFADLTSRFLAELKESLVSAQDFSSFVPRLEKQFPHAGPKYRELALLYTCYEETLARTGLRDRHDTLFLLEEGLKGGKFETPHFRRVWIDGFFDFSKLQLAFIRFLTHHAESVTVTLTMDESRHASTLFDTCEKTKQALLGMGFCIPGGYSVSYRTKDKSLIHLAENLFSDEEPKKLPAPRSVRILEAAGIRGELEMIAQEIKKIVRRDAPHPASTRRGGTNYSDIALIFRRVGPYVGVLRSVFDRYEIPFEIHEREELRLHPVARTLVSFFKIFLGDWKREDVLNFLKSGWVRADAAFVWQMELEALRSGMLRGRSAWLEKFNFSFFQTLSEFEDAFRKTSELKQWILLTARALETFGINHVAEAVTDENRLAHAALKRIRLLLSEIERKYTGSGLDFSAYAEALIRLIEVDLFSFHTRDKNRVQIYNVSLARQKEYKVVFLPGLLEKQFPMQMKENPILSDEERRFLNQGGEVLKEQLPRQSIERYFFYLALTRASEALILSYPRFDLEGKEALPSFYVDEVEVLFRDGLEKRAQSVSDVLAPLAHIATLRDGAAHVVRAFWQAPAAGKTGQKKPPRNLGEMFFLYNHFLAEPWFREAVRSLTVPVEGKITDGGIRSFFRPEFPIYSPTLLETYAECPYRYFASYALGLESEEEGIDVRVVGTILHEVLERFHGWRRDKKVSEFNLELIRAKSAEFLEEALAKYPLSGARWHVIELQKRSLAETLVRVLREELIEGKPPLPNLKPEYFEFAFGTSEKKDYLILREGKEELRLRGRVDRIDVDETKTYGLIVDYKLGEKFERSKLQNNTMLQLPIYLLAMEERLGLKPLGAHLYALSAAHSTGFHHADNLKKAGIETRKGTAFSEESWGNLFGRIVRFLFRCSRGIRNAEIPVRPRDCVKYCPFGELCRIEKWRLEYIYRDIKEDDEKSEKEIKTG